MKEALQELWEQLEAAVTLGRGASDAGDLDLARDAARVTLSVGSKLHQRLSILVDMRSDAAWSAEVDRAMRRAAAVRAEIPGQSSIADALKGGAASPGPAEGKPEGTRSRAKPAPKGKRGG